VSVVERREASAGVRMGFFDYLDAMADVMAALASSGP
jgi:hypothetical protein